MSATPTNRDGYAGQQQPSDAASDFAVINFMIRQFLGRVWTMMPVKVMAVNTDAQTVDVLPLVKQMDGQGQTTSHGTIFGIQYSRDQGGTSAIIIDPVIGDIGTCVFSHRDISAVKTNKAESQPGSYRRFNPSDGVYHGGILNIDPTQFIRMSPSGGIELVSPTKVSITAPEIDTTGVLKNNGVIVGSTHTHSGVTSGGGTSGPPT